RPGRPTGDPATRPRHEHNPRGTTTMCCSSEAGADSSARREHAGGKIEERGEDRILVVGSPDELVVEQRVRSRYPDGHGPVGEVVRDGFGEDHGGRAVPGSDRPAAAGRLACFLRLETRTPTEPRVEVVQPRGEVAREEDEVVCQGLEWKLVALCEH